MVRVIVPGVLLNCIELLPMVPELLAMDEALEPVVVIFPSKMMRLPSSPGLTPLFKPSVLPLRVSPPLPTESVVRAVELCPPTTKLSAVETIVVPLIAVRLRLLKLIIEPEFPTKRVSPVLPSKTPAPVTVQFPPPPTLNWPSLTVRLPMVSVMPLAPVVPFQPDPLKTLCEPLMVIDAVLAICSFFDALP